MSTSKNLVFLIYADHYFQGAILTTMLATRNFSSEYNAVYYSSVHLIVVMCVGASGGAGCVLLVPPLQQMLCVNYFPPLLQCIYTTISCVFCQLLLWQRVQKVVISDEMLLRISERNIYLLQRMLFVHFTSEKQRNILPPASTSHLR